jgi:hypothetical protein
MNPVQTKPEKKLCRVTHGFASGGEAIATIELVDTEIMGSSRFWIVTELKNGPPEIRGMLAKAECDGRVRLTLLYPQIDPEMFAGWRIFFRRGVRIAHVSLRPDERPSAYGVISRHPFVFLPLPEDTFVVNRRDSVLHSKQCGVQGGGCQRLADWNDTIGDVLRRGGRVCLACQYPPTVAKRVSRIAPP